MRAETDAGPATARRFIVTADDFGLDVAVNEAVEHAYRDGVLSATSLMVGAPAAADAIARATALPGLAVGLHLTLVDGVPVSDPRALPALVDDHGRFVAMGRIAQRLAISATARHQLATEIHAQFRAFAATGLALDHVNAHKHFHLHPVIAHYVIVIGRQYGLSSLRLPRESQPARGGGVLVRAERLATAASAAGLRRRIWRAHLHCNDWIRGLPETGQMNEHVFLDALATAPAGLTEIYTHPATRNGLTPAMAEYDHVGELTALTSPRVKQAFADAGITPRGFAAHAHTQ